MNALSTILIILVAILCVICVLGYKKLQSQTNNGSANLSEQLELAKKEAVLAAKEALHAERQKFEDEVSSKKAAKEFALSKCGKSFSRDRI